MAPAEEKPEIIDGYPNFEWSPGNIITDDYKNKDDDKSEYKHRKGSQEDISLKDELNINETLEEEYEIQEMGK